MRHTATEKPKQSSDPRLATSEHGAALTGWRRPRGKKCQEKQPNCPTRKMQRTAKAAADFRRCRGRCAPSTIAADEHPQAARRFAPHNQRMHLAAPVHDPFGLIPGLAGDPQRLAQGLIDMQRIKQSTRKSILCLIDESGSLEVAIPEPFRVGFLITARPERLISDIRTLKRELPPRGKSGEFHAREDHPNTRAKIRALLCLNNEPRMHIVEWVKADFSPEFIVNGKLMALRDTNPLIASFALTASDIAAAASATGSPLVDIVAEASKGDILSEHRSREQAFSQVIGIAIQKQARIKRAPIGTRTEIRVSTRRKSQYPPLSFVDYWLWAYCRHSDSGDVEVLPDALKRRTTVRRMTESDVKYRAEKTAL